MVYKDDFTEGLAHWLVFYRTKSGKLSHMTIDAREKESAMLAVKHLARRFKDFERMGDGTPIIKRKVYAHEMCIG